MNAPKCNEYDYIDFLIATPKVYSCTQAARVQPDHDDAPSHDAINRLLLRIETDSQDLWQEARHQIDLKSGVLMLDDSTLDKQYAKKIELVSRHWSGKHRKVVCGINLITLLWTDGDRYIPCDYRFFDKPTDGSTKNDHFRKMLLAAKERGFEPACVLFDSWYGSIDNLKTIRNSPIGPSSFCQSPVCTCTPFKNCCHNSSKLSSSSKPSAKAKPFAPPQTVNGRQARAVLSKMTWPIAR